MAAVHLGRLRVVWFGAGTESVIGIALLRGLPPREDPCSASIARVSLSRSAMSKASMSFVGIRKHRIMWGFTEIAPTKLLEANPNAWNPVHLQKLQYSHQPSYLAARLQNRAAPLC